MNGSTEADKGTTGQNVAKGGLRFCGQRPFVTPVFGQQPIRDILC